ncbi:MAG: hypothetical protein LBK95_12105 [Bifidobacteriaceae bacterium]|jgi:hypothetical protein|nr:hypothetical protein [Bifidobacteriaceae bacterium]
MDGTRRARPAATAEGGLASELRNWARGALWAQAAVALLVNGVRGRLAYREAPWIEQLGTGADGKPYARIDPGKLTGQAGPLSSGERLVAKVVANLIDDETMVPLADLARLDPREARIVLGALRQAAGLRPPVRAARPDLTAAAPARSLPPPGL